VWAAGWATALDAIIAAFFFCLLPLPPFLLHLSSNTTQHYDTLFCAELLPK